MSRCVFDVVSLRRGHNCPGPHAVSLEVVVDALRVVSIVSLLLFFMLLMWHCDCITAAVDTMQSRLNQHLVGSIGRFPLVCILYDFDWER